ncbi:MAG: cysteine-rich CWC family protein [Bacteroidales bacterium]|nr:cysteine-rich CWC family protein [Bacteroidales bacterium]MCF8387027.1 cysteine-rich CWC family protein [Bacteroidales bacterium]MCF8398744.1 cysteine-rich CWC family protein [Bacteroidales bacterium]
MKQRLTEKDICPYCRKEFDCSRSKRCWCHEHDLSPEAMEEIEKDYEACLCPACIGMFED